MFVLDRHLTLLGVRHLVEFILTTETTHERIPGRSRPDFEALSHFPLFFTGRNEVVAKVIFLQASVCPRGVCLVPGGVLSPGGCT